MAVALVLLFCAGEVVLVYDGQPVAVHGAGWKRVDGALEGAGKGNDLEAGVALEPGDFHVRAHLRLLEQKGSAASFFLDASHFGFEGARNTLFVSGPLFGGLKLLGDPTRVFKRGAWIRFEAIRKGDTITFRIDGKEIAKASSTAGFARFGLRPWRATMQVKAFSVEGNTRPLPPPRPPGYAIPVVDISGDTRRQVVVDREKGQYLGHVTTVLLEDQKTMIAVYPKGHGRGAIVMKRSTDAGLTWSERLKTPENWATSREVPTIHRVIDAQGKKRLILWSGLYPARLAVSEDDGKTWTPLRPAGDWGGIVVMGAVVALKTPGRYLAMFHDDGRFFRKGGKRTGIFTLYQTVSEDGGLTWSHPEAIHRASRVHLCEPGIVRSPDGKQLAALLRENSRTRNSHVILSDDEGKTWSEPRELPAALTGDRHIGRYAPDGRLFLTFRDTTRKSATQGDWVGWVGTYADLVNGREGQYRVRLLDNHHRWDCAYPGLEMLPDGTIVTTTYGHWVKGERPFIVSVRFKLAELDPLAKR